MNGLTFAKVNDQNKLIAREWVKEYSDYLLNELKLMAKKDQLFKEVENFPGDNYKSPDGAFFIIYYDQDPAGCVGLKRFDSSSRELKRMYIKEQFRGKGFAKTVIKFILDEALFLGYEKMFLETNLKMPAAINAYLKAGFAKIPQYCENENPNPVFLVYYLI